MKRTFASLSPVEALRIAILIEDRNTQLYVRLGELFAEFCPSCPELGKTFLSLANTEHSHSTMLTARYMERFGAMNDEITEEEIVDFIEVPSVSMNHVLKAISVGSSKEATRLALEIAGAAERSAVNYYRRLAETTRDTTLKSIYQEFLAFEQEHTDWVDAELEKQKPTLAFIQSAHS